MPASVWVGPAHVDDRIDTRPYKPWVLERTERCSEFVGGSVRLGDPGVCSQLSRGVGGGKGEADVIAVFKAKEVTGYGFSAPERFLANCPNDKVLRSGDVVLTSSGIGTIGRADIFDPSSVSSGTRFTVDNHVTIVRLSTSELLPEFLVSFLNCDYGKAWSEWGTTGSTRLLELSPSKVRQFEIPKVDLRVQRFVAARIRLAARCRSHSVELRSRALELLAQSWAWGNRGPADLQDGVASQIAHTVEPHIFEDRLDPEFYRPSFLAVDRWLDGQPCWRLSELVEAPVKGVQPSYDPDGTVPALTVTHVDPFVLDRNEANGLVTDAWLSRNSRARIEAGELLYTVTGPPLGETVVVEEFHLPAAVNSHVARVALRPHFKFPHLVAGMLNSPLGQLQTTRYSKGIRQKELYPVDFVRFRFPKLSSQTCTRLERELAASCRLVEEARVLVEQAKADVEALIEDTFDVEAILAGTVKAPTADDIPELAEYTA